MILVVGATGSLGTEICRCLRAKGKPVRALVRSTSNAAKVSSLRDLGVSFAQGDLTDRASLDAACTGATTVISTVSTSYSRQPDIAGVDHAGQLRLVDAAKAAGVSHFIYISFSGHFTTDVPLINAKRAVEQHLKQSGMTYTIVRSTFFMEAMFSPTAGFDYPNAKVTIYGTGLNKISWIAIPDVARFAAESVDNPAARNATLEIGGPEALSPLEVVHIFEGVEGRSFDVQHFPEEAIQAQKAQATDPLQQSFMGMMLEYTKGDVVDMTSTLGTFPLKLTSVKEFAQRTWNSNAQGGANMSVESNKRLMERMIEEIWNKGNMMVARELFHADHYSPSAPDLPKGPESVIMLATMFRSAMPDYHMTIDMMVADERKVVARFTQSGTHVGAPLMGMEASGRRAEWTEIGVLEIENGKIVRSWYEVDMLSMIQQLNPQPAQNGAATPEEREALIYRMYDETNKGNIDVLRELLADNFVSYGGAGFQDLHGPEVFINLYRTFVAAFPDLRFDVQQVVVGKDMAAVRGIQTGTHRGNFLGMVPATGKHVEWTGTAIFRFDDQGKIVERWQDLDNLTLFQQLGVIPAFQSAGG